MRRRLSALTLNTTARYLAHLLGIVGGVAIKALVDGGGTFAPLLHQNFWVAVALAAGAWLIMVLAIFERTGELPPAPPAEPHPLRPPAPPELAAALPAVQPPPASRLRSMEPGRPSYTTETPANLAAGN